MLLFIQILHVSKIVPFSENSNVRKVIERGNNFIIPSRNFVDDENSGSIILVDSDFNAINEFHYVGTPFGRKSPYKIGSKYYGYCDHGSEAKYLSLIIINDDLTMDTSFNYTSLSTDNGVSSTIVLAEYLYDVSVDRFSELERQIHIKKIDTLGKVLWARNYGQNVNYSFIIEADTTMDQHILLSGETIVSGEFKGLAYKLDQEGEVIWQYIGEESLDDVSSQQWIAELSSEDIILATTVDYGDSLDFIVNDWNDRVPKFRWLDAEGIEYRTKLLPTDKPERISLTGVNGLRDQGFLAFGSINHPDLEGDYGWILKMSNEGDIIWHRKYYHPEIAEEGYHAVREILELDNGDLIVLGRVAIPGENIRIWMMRLNSEGCFGDTGDCGTDIISATDDVADEIRAISVYPNPVTDRLHLDVEIPSTYSIFDVEGNMVMTGKASHTIEVSSLPSGTYLVRWSGEDKKSGLSRFVKL